MDADEKRDEREYPDIKELPLRVSPPVVLVPLEDEPDVPLPIPLPPEAEAGEVAAPRYPFAAGNGSVSKTKVYIVGDWKCVKVYVGVV